MDTLEKVRAILRDTLQLGKRADGLKRESRLLGEIPEFDSMAVVSVLTMVEEEFGIAVADDELSAEVFETLGSLSDFIARKTSTYTRRSRPSSSRARVERFWSSCGGLQPRAQDRPCCVCAAAGR